MKKEDGISLIVYALMIVIAVVVGLVVIGPMFSKITGNNMGFAFLFVIVAILINVIILELAHLIGALIGGYSIVSFNILGLCLYRKDNKWKFKFSNFDGLTGETKVTPKKENASVKMFALFPLLAYLIEVIVCMIIYYVLKTNINASNPARGQVLLVVLSLMNITVGGMLELYNIFPAHLDSTTDGYRLVVISKKENVKAYNELMRIEACLNQGKDVGDMLVFNEITDFTASVNLYTVYKFLKEKKFDDAGLILDNIVNNKAKISKDTYCSAVAQKLYIILLTKTLEEAKAYYDANLDQMQRKYISNDLSMQSIRAYLLISSMLDISENEARYAISRKAKAIKRTPAGRVDIENELYEIALNKVNEIRPEWHIKEKVIQ